jgi:hypothetical protein
MGDQGDQVVNWRKASASANGGEQCVEVGELGHGVAVRDSQDRQGAVLRIHPAAWCRFVGSLR